MDESPLLPSSESESKNVHNLVSFFQSAPLTRDRPENVGILAAEVYFPRNYISQKDYEDYCGCPGKFTEGLGQTNMAYVDDQEDICSVFTNALKNLLSLSQGFIGPIQ